MKNKGFTLIELLATIIILGLIGLIVYPTINRIITENREKLYNNQVEEIERMAESWTVKHMNLVPSENNKSYYLEVDELYNSGLIQQDVVYNPKTNEKMPGCVIITWKNDINQYTYTYDEKCTHIDPPVISLTIANGTINSNGWAASNFYVNVSGENLDKYSYCVSNSECTPNTEVNSSTGTIYVTTEGTNYVCVKGINKVGETEVICNDYKMDKTEPEFVSTSIYYDKAGDITDYVDVTFGSSGGTINCDKTISELTDVTNTVWCRAVSNNGISINQKMSFILNMLKTNIRVYNSDTTFLGGTLKRNQVKAIYVVDHKNIPSGATSWDVSISSNGSIMAWYTNPDSNGLYDLYIGQNGGVVANSGYHLFSYFDKATVVDIEKLDTSKVTNMESMFQNNHAITIDASSLDTSNVTNVKSMFLESQATIINVSRFDTSKVTNMANMFYDTKVTKLDVSGFDTSNVTDMHSMFYQSQATTITGLNNFNTSKVTNMANMFKASRATELDLSHFDTSSVTDMAAMFSYCRATKLDLSSFDTSNVTIIHFIDGNGNKSSMFDGSSAITIIFGDKFNTSKITDMEAMFRNSSVKTLDLSGFDTSNVTNMNNMFNSTKATVGYAKTQADADRFNASSNKPGTLTFTVK